jgi:hypothetical protein
MPAPAMQQLEAVRDECDDDAHFGQVLEAGILLVKARRQLRDVAYGQIRKDRVKRAETASSTGFACSVRSGKFEADSVASLAEAVAKASGDRRGAAAEADSNAAIASGHHRSQRHPRSGGKFRRGLFKDVTPGGNPLNRG